MMRLQACKNRSGLIFASLTMQTIQDHKVNISSDFCDCSMTLSATINHLICPLSQAAKQTEGCYFSHTGLVLLMAELLTSKQILSRVLSTIPCESASE